MGKSKGLSENPQHPHEKLPVTPALCEVATEESLDLLAASLASVQIQWQSLSQGNKVQSVETGYLKFFSGFLVHMGV